MHKVGDVETLSRQITMLHENRDLLQKFRAVCLASSPSLTWTAAGARLLDVYRETIEAHKAAQSGVDALSRNPVYSHSQV